MHRQTHNLWKLPEVTAVAKRGGSVAGNLLNAPAPSLPSCLGLLQQKSRVAGDASPTHNLWELPEVTTVANAVVRLPEIY
jgi:hypothetical protein